MGRILRDIVNDIEVILKDTYDDREFEKSHIAWWCTIIGDRLKSQHILKRKSGAFKKTFVGLPILTHSSITNPNQIPNRQYVELPGCIYDFDMDGGIDYMSYWDSSDACGSEYWKKRKILRTEPSEVEVLEYSPYTKPSAENPYFYRLGNYIYILGLECSAVEEIEMCIYMVLPDVRTVDLDAEWDFPAELITVLQRHVLDIARFGLEVPEVGKVNTGADNSTSQNVPTQKLVSVNDPAINSEGT